MTDFERERLSRYIADAGQWLTNIQTILQYPETPAQVAALTLIRVAIELVNGVKQQIEIDGGL